MIAQTYIHRLAEINWELLILRKQEKQAQESERLLNQLRRCKRCNQKFKYREMHQSNEKWAIGVYCTVCIEILKREHTYTCRNCNEELDHFIPSTKGGGTTAKNCIPACRTCNYDKKNFNPIDPPIEFLAYFTLPKRISIYLIYEIERVAEYLNIALPYSVKQLQEKRDIGLVNALNSLNGI